MRGRQIPLLILVVLAAFLLFFETPSGWRARNYLEGNFRGGASDEKSLALENGALKAGLAELRLVRAELPQAQKNYLRAMVYSRYPMNFKNEILLNAGKKEGVAAGKAVLFGGALIGKVERVFDDSSLVETIFDNRFQASARVGPFGVDALFKGGSFPKVALMPLNAQISPGDIIYSASPDFPYGLPIGEVNKIEISSDKLFKEASLNFAYDINGVRTVLMEK